MFLRDARSLHPTFKKKTSGQAAFGRLAYTMSNVLKSTGMYVKSASNFAVDIKLQYNLYQTVEIAYDAKAPLDQYWTTVAAYVDNDGKCCFAELGTLAKHCLSVSHGNAVPERGFSINKQMLRNRTQLKDNTIVSLRLVKESLELYDRNVSVIFNLKHRFYYLSCSFLLYKKGGRFSYHSASA